MKGGRRLVRLREDFEMRCDDCGDWWPLTMEYWGAQRALSRCRACWNAYTRLKQRGYLADEARREVARTRARLSYQMRKSHRRASNAAWRAAHKEHIAAYNKEYRARHKAEIAAQQRKYYAESPEIARFKRHVAYENETPEQRERRRQRDRDRYMARKAAA